MPVPLIPDSVEPYPCGFRREWFCKRRLVVYVVPRADAETLRIWAEVATQTGVDWPQDQLYLGLHDFSTAHVVFSPAVYAAALHMSRSTSHLRGYFAGIVPNPVIASTVDRLLTLNLLPLVPGLQMRLFSTREDGLDWLCAHL